MRKIEMIGQRFGKLAVVAEAPPHILPSGKPQRMYFVDCDCGRSTAIRGKHLRSGAATTCGCSRGGLHGESRRGQRAAEYGIWAGMLTRCRNPKANGYENYGGRGIKVCARWVEGEGGASGYECFLADVGRRPSPAHSIDRENNNGNYEPGNCRWATRLEQNRNQRKRKRVRDRQTQSNITLF